MTSSIMAKVKTNVVIFSESALWDQWCGDTKASVLSQMWKYFDPDSDAAFTELVEPVIPVDEPPPDKNEPLQVWNAHITRYQRTIRAESSYLAQRRLSRVGASSRPNRLFQQHKAKHSETHHGRIYGSWNQLVDTFSLGASETALIAKTS